MRAFCERRDWTVYGEYVDTGWSGGKRDRPQLEKLMLAARKHMFDVVMCWKLDRFGRSVANFVEHLSQLEHWGIRFMCTSQSIDTDQQNPGSRLLMQILAAVAEFERSMIRERVKAGMAAAKRRGKRLGRPRGTFDRDKIIELHLRGKSSRQIGAELGIHWTTVCKLIPKAPKTAA
jgi:DNA invertase Pin-like site-specific DNA recombinase